MKKMLVFLLFAFVLAFTNIASAAHASSQQAHLSNMSEDECIEFIKTYGVEIPTEYEEFDELGSLVKIIICSVENDPNCRLGFNYSVMYDFANAIKEAVNTYYGIDRNVRASSLNTQHFTLIDSVTYGPWNDSYTMYNCYAYATSQTMLASGGGYFAPYPGYFSSNSFSISDPVSEWAELTLEDLHEIDYSCVYVSTSYSDTMDLADTHTIICLRQSPGVDYHYMRLNGDHWYHKPADTHVLRYLHLPYEKDWSNECSYDGIVYPGVIFYTGTIYYFAFAEDHSYGEPLYTGNNYHQGKLHYFEYVSNCEDCGNAIYTWASEICSGPPCEIDITAVDENQHVCE